MRHALAVDGGKTTGLAILDAARPLPAVTLLELPYEAALLTIDEWAEEHRGCGDEDVLVPERFVITPGTAKKSPGGWTDRTNGVCDLAGAKHGLRVDDSQTARAAKGFARDPLLRDLGWWHPSDHARDAARHLATYLARRERALFDQLLRAAGR